jgi:hypothetical protein
VSARFVHVINPAKVGPGSSLHVAQPITFESLRVAQEFASVRGVDVDLCAANFPEDDEVLPDFFRHRQHLTRSVLDLGQFKIERKLPLIADILDAARSTSNAPHIIYTNVDIAVQPHFYMSIDEIIRRGVDACMITRRTLKKDYTSPSQLPEMYADPGEEHPGDDCFIFSRAAYEKFDLGDACIGIKFVARILGFNIIVHAQRFEHFKNLRLTFHIGDDRVWDDEKYADYTAHNRRVLQRVVPQFKRRARKIDNPLVTRLVKKFGTSE